MAEYIEFVLEGPTASGKTYRYKVVAKDGGDFLGIVSWYGPWRCYAFEPMPGTVFEKKCLRSIAEFCESRTNQHRGTRSARPVEAPQ